MSYHQFISFLKAGSEDLTVTVRLSTFDTLVNYATGDVDPITQPELSNIDISTSITIDGGNDEITTAKNFYTQLNQFLSDNNAQYVGVPVFTGTYPLTSFRATRTEHVISMWSQAQFDITITPSVVNNDWTVVVADKPILVTLPDAQFIASISGVDLSDINDDDLTPKQLSYLLNVASSKIVSILSNNIVMCPYLHEAIGRGSKSLFFKVRPIYDFDVPLIRRPRITQLTTFLINRSKSAYTLNKQSGELEYRFTNDLVDIDEAFGLSNEIKISYIAGHQNIPMAIKQAVITMCSDVLENTSMKSLKGGGFEVEFRPPSERLTWMLQEIAPYQLR